MCIRDRITPPLSVATAKAGMKIRSAAIHVINPLLNKFPQVLLAITEDVYKRQMRSRATPYSLSYAAGNER